MPGLWDLLRNLQGGDEFVDPSTGMPMPAPSWTIPTPAPATLPVPGREPWAGLSTAVPSGPEPWSGPPRPASPGRGLGGMLGAQGAPAKQPPRSGVKGNITPPAAPGNPPGETTRRQEREET